MILRLAASAALAAALATPSSAGPDACTPSAAGVTLGGCVHVVCLKLCVTEVHVDPQCSIDRPVPLAVQSACSRVDGEHVVVGGG